MELQDRKIIVTGGARGIGRTAVEAYVAQGARVALLDVDSERGEAVAASVSGPGSARYYQCDIASREAVDATFDAAAAAAGGLDVLVNCAGIERFCAAQDIGDDDWERMFAINVKGTMLTNQAAFRHMKDSGGGIINFGSDAALMPYPGGAHYSASKGAVTSWTRTVAHEWGRYGITVNTLVPAMWTPMYDDHRATLSPDELAQHDAMMQGLIPLGGRLGDPARDLAPMLLFLAGEGARFITGQVLSVNGGLNTVR